MKIHLEKMILLLLLFLLTNQLIVNGLPHGTPRCVKVPVHGGNQRKDPMTLPYSTIYQRQNNKIEIMLKAPSTVPFKGLTILTKNKGVFINCAGMHPIQCTGEKNSLGPEWKAMTHDNANEKYEQKCIFTLDDPRADATFVLSVVENFATFWGNIMMGSKKKPTNTTNQPVPRTTKGATSPAPVTTKMPIPPVARTTKRSIPPVNPPVPATTKRSIPPAPRTTRKGYPTQGPKSTPKPTTNAGGVKTTKSDKQDDDDDSGCLAIHANSIISMQIIVLSCYILQYYFI